MADKTVTIGSGKTYSSLSAAIAGELTANADSVTMQGILHLQIYASTYTSGATVSGFTVSETCYVSIEVAEDEGHEGYWDDNKANFYVSGNGKVLIIENSYTRVKGLQIGVYGASDYDYDPTCIFLNTGIQGCEISENILRNTCNQSYHFDTFAIHGPYGVNGGHKVFNNTIYGFKANSYNTGAFGIRIVSWPNYIYSNTIIDCQKGISLIYLLSCKNNLFANCTTPFFGTVDTEGYTSDYNTTDLESFGQYYVPGDHDRVSQDFTFVDDNNYLLDLSDEGALGYGTDLNNDPNCPFDTDIIRNSRNVPWSMGSSQPQAESGDITGISAASLVAPTSTTSATQSLIGVGLATWPSITQVAIATQSILATSAAALIPLTSDATVILEISSESSAFIESLTSNTTANLEILANSNASIISPISDTLVVQTLLANSTAEIAALTSYAIGTIGDVNNGISVASLTPIVCTSTASISNIGASSPSLIAIQSQTTVTQLITGTSAASLVALTCHAVDILLQMSIILSATLDIDNSGLSAILDLDQ